MTIESILKQCIIDSPKTVRQIAAESGLKHVSNLYLFIKDKRDIHIRTADKLIAYFGLELTINGMKYEDHKRYERVKLEKLPGKFPEKIMGRTAS